MRNHFNSHNTKERRLLHFATKPTSSPTPDPDKKPEKKEGADKAKMEELNTALEGIDQEGKLTDNAKILAKMEIEETQNGQNESLADLEKGLRDIAQLQYDDILDSGKNPEDALKQLNEDLVKTGRTFTVDEKGSVDLVAVAKKPEISAEKKPAGKVEKGAEKVTEDLRELFKQLVKQLNELLGKIKPKEEEKKDGDKPKEGKEQKETVSKDPKEMKTSAIDKELGDIDKTMKDFDKQLDDLPDVTRDNAEEVRKKIADIQASKSEVKVRKDALEAEKTRRTELIKKDWETAKKTGAKEPAITGVRIEGDDLVFDLTKGGNMVEIQKIAEEAGFTVLSDGRLQDVPAKIYEESGDIATARVALLTALAKIENAGAEKPEEPKKTKGPKESKETLDFADKLNQQKAELLSGAPAMKETVLGSIFDKMTYKMAPDGKNIVIDIAAGDFDKMLAIGKANRRGITVSPDGNTITFSGGPGGDTWSMTRGETIVMPCHKAWGGEKNNVDSQFKMAETGMNKWASTMVSKVPDTQKPLDVKGKTIDVKESAETAEAKNVSSALEDLKSSLPKGVKELPVGKFLDSLTIKDGADGKIVYLSSMKPGEGDPTQVDKEFAYFYEKLFIPGTPVGVDKATGQYAISFDKSFADSNVYELNRMKAWLSGQTTEGGTGAFARGEEGGNTVEKPKKEKEGGAEKLDESYETALNDIATKVEEMHSLVKNENGAIDSLSDDGSVSPDSTLYQRLQEIDTAINGSDLKVPEGRSLGADLGNKLADKGLLDKFTSGDGQEYRIFMDENGIGVERVKEEASTPKSNVEKGKEVDPSKKKTEKLMRDVRDFAAVGEVDGFDKVNKGDMKRAVDAARNAIVEEGEFLNTGNSDQVEAANRIQVLDQYKADLDNYESMFALESVAKKQKTEEAMQSARDFASVAETGGSYNKSDFGKSVDIARNALKEERDYLVNNSNIPTNESDARLAVLDQYTNDLDYYEETYAMQESFEEISTVLDDQFSELSRILDGPGYEDGKEDWGPILKKINEMHELAGYDYRPEITGQEFYDQGTSETYILVENDKNEYELKSKSGEVQKQSDQIRKELNSHFNEIANTLDSAGFENGKDQWGPALAKINELHTGAGYDDYRPEITGQEFFDQDTGETYILVENDKNEFELRMKNEESNKAKKMLTNISAAVARRSGLSSKEQATVRNGFSVEHTNDRYVLTIDTNMVGKGKFSVPQMEAITQGLSFDGNRAISVPMSFEEFSNYVTEFITRVNKELPESA